MQQKNFIMLLVVLFVLGLVVGVLTGDITGNAMGDPSKSRYGGSSTRNPGQDSYGDRYAYLKEIGSNPVTTIEIRPKSLLAGEYIDITIDPGVDGARKEVLVYKTNEAGYGVRKKGDAGGSGTSGGAGGSITNFCENRLTSGYKCFATSTIRYRTDSIWNGLYEVRVFDLHIRDYVKETFTVTWQPKGIA